jgi:acetyl-CoA carboxylase biotin carboxylase subunit
MGLARVIVANRGEIASRIIRACNALDLETILTVSDADRDSLPARQAGRVVCIGPAAPSKSYLNRKAIVAAALGTGADALHPGYGFLSESPELAALCAANGITFIGPRPDHIQQMGNKLQAVSSPGGRAFQCFRAHRRCQLIKKLSKRSKALAFQS